MLVWDNNGFVWVFELNKNLRRMYSGGELIINLYGTDQLGSNLSGSNFLNAKN